ncbi:MAG: ParB N-terminal domain-containing protein [Firmicutes bacterium]|nr:ParB N-terminal domain-containing protein [Bacillota bacterium]
MAFGEKNLMTEEEKKKKEQILKDRRRTMFQSAEPGSTVDPKQAVSSVPNIINIPIHLIDPNPDNEDLNGTKDIEALSSAISEDGFLGVIIVIKKGNGRYEISWGHRRFLALKENKAVEVPCLVLEKKDEIEKAKLLLRGNMNVRDVTPMIFAKRIQYYIDHVFKPSHMKGKAKDAAAAFFGIGPSNVHRYLCLLKLNEDLQNLTDDPDFAFSALQTAVNLDSVEQKELFQWIQQKKEQNHGLYPTRKEIEEEIKRIHGITKENPKEGKKESSSKKSEIYMDSAILHLERVLASMRKNCSVIDRGHVLSSIQHIKEYIDEIESNLTV